MTHHRSHLRAALLGATALIGALALSAGSAAAQEREYTFDLPAQPLGAALRLYARTAQEQVIFTDEAVRGRTAPALSGAYSAEEALQVLLAGTDLKVHRTASGIVQITVAQGPQGGSAEDVSAVEELIVTAQKREEAIQDVPIAISAFSQKALEEQKIEGGFDLLKAIPNVTFSKNNFTGYNFSIRGIGTKAVSATTDPAVAVSFNNTTLMRNRLFEQEYFDVERVEVLRGPQGTLYGRNATSGVINVITAKPRLGEFSGQVDLETGNFNAKRVRGTVNLPVGETFALRFAGSMTQRDGYGYNTFTKSDVDGRDLWSTRLSAQWEPIDRLRVNAVWEHFEEDDNRARTTKQLCHRDPGPASIAGVSTGGDDQLGNFTRSMFSQGCLPGSLYEDEAYGMPNGASLPYVGVGWWFSLGFSEPPYLPDGSVNPTPGSVVPMINGGTDPYGGRMQSRDLRTIDTQFDPTYRASADIYQLNLELDITDALTFYSQTAYNVDEVRSTQDYNRFRSLPVFNDSSVLWTSSFNSGVWSSQPAGLIAPGGVFCDFQLGCSDTISGLDISQGESTQFSQEFRLQSSFEGPLNFSLGANYTNFEVNDDYYVFFNMLTAATTLYANQGLNGGADGLHCGNREGTNRRFCSYVDVNPIGSLNGMGHNYFRSQNPYKLDSRAVFGELYWRPTEALKITAGLRYTVDRKMFTRWPSQAASQNVLGRGAGNVPIDLLNRPECIRPVEELIPLSCVYYSLPDIEQGWSEPTGRIGFDWTTSLPFTDETMVYGFYSRGYKGGGANPPGIGGEGGDALMAIGAANPTTFEPEFVDALEIGVKNTLLGGAMTLNLGAFHYDYKDYQVSQIVDRIALNENFDAKTWGIEVEALWRVTQDLRVNANLGYLETEIAEGESSIDVMNRTQSDPDWMVMRPFINMASNCIVPVAVIADILAANRAAGSTQVPNGLVYGFFIANNLLTPGYSICMNTSPSYDLSTAPNGGRGIAADLSGNELPNAPHWTTSLGAQYGFDMPGGWRGTVRGDFYWQSQSSARVFNTQADKLRAWTNTNLSLWFEKPDWNVRAEVYVKNVFDETPITDAFLNSDDTGLTTNVFTLDPRLIGVSVRKSF